MRTLVFGILAFSALVAQEPAPAPPAKPALQNTGKPMRVPVQCGEEDLRALGLTCTTRHPCPVYLELSGLEIVGARIFAAGNLHTGSATLSSILLASDDGGRSWHEPHERIRSAGLEQIQFLDFETGWIGGQSLGAVPRDPFLLLTRDGGKTWRSRPVLPDGQVGVIDGFRFESKTDGLLWIDRITAADGGDRYEAYESRTGGESWALRQTSRQPFKELKEKGVQPGPAGWRLRADRASQSYRVERQAGERWESVAGFLVSAGECKEAEYTLPPPPEPPEPAEEGAPEPAIPTPSVPARPPTLNKP